MAGIKSGPEKQEYGKGEHMPKPLRLNASDEKTEKAPVQEFQEQIRKLRPKHQQMMSEANSPEQRDAVIARIKKDFQETAPPKNLPDLSFTQKNYVSFTKLEGEKVLPEDYNLKITKVSNIYAADLKKAA